MRIDEGCAPIFRRTAFVYKIRSGDTLFGSRTLCADRQGAAESAGSVEPAPLDICADPPVQAASFFEPTRIQMSGKIAHTLARTPTISDSLHEHKHGRSTASGTSQEIIQQKDNAHRSRSTNVCKRNFNRSIFPRGEGGNGRGEVGGGWAYKFHARLGRSTIDHEELSTRRGEI